MTKKAIRVQDPYFKDQFKIFLTQVLAANQNKEFPRENPIRKSMAVLSGGKDEKDQKYAKRIMRYVDHLITEGIVNFQVDMDVLYRRSRELFEQVDGDRAAVNTAEEEELVKALHARGINIHVFYSEDHLFKSLSTSILESIERRPDHKILLGSGTTIGSIRKYLQPEDRLIRLLSKKSQPIFYPSAGNFYSNYELSTRDAEYLYNYSPNANSMALNNILGLPSMFLDVPRVLVLPKQGKGGETLPMVRQIGYLQQLKFYFKQTEPYKKVYALPEASTIIVSPGSSRGETRELAHLSYLSTYSPDASMKDVEYELFLRFFNKQGQLIGNENTKKFKLGERRKPGDKRLHKANAKLDQSDIFTLFYQSYLGLKEGFCAKVAAQHQKEKSGLGTVLLATTETKIPTLALALKRPAKFINQIYILKALLPSLREKLGSTWLRASV